MLDGDVRSFYQKGDLDTCGHECYLGGTVTLSRTGGYFLVTFNCLGFKCTYCIGTP